MTIAVVDDEKNIRMAVSSALEKEGFQAVQYADGAAAAGPEPDLYILDILMPVMDGLEATRKIRETDRPDASTVPIIAMTANAFDEDVQRSLQVGMNAHLSKPIEPEKLIQTLEELIWEAENKE